MAFCLVQNAVALHQVSYGGTCHRRLNLANLGAQIRSGMNACILECTNETSESMSLFVINSSLWPSFALPWSRNGLYPLYVTLLVIFNAPIVPLFKLNSSILELPCLKRSKLELLFHPA